jgi:hypothetical protein
MWTGSCTPQEKPSAAPRRAAAGVALQTGAVADHGEVAAFGAGLADTAFHARLRRLAAPAFAEAVVPVISRGGSTV